MTIKTNWVEEIKDITHSRGVNDVRGSCGSRCFQCLKDSPMFEIIRTQISLAQEGGSISDLPRKKGYKQGIRDGSTKTKNGVSRYQLGYEDGLEEGARAAEAATIERVRKCVDEKRHTRESCDCEGYGCSLNISLNDILSALTGLNHTQGRVDEAKTCTGCKKNADEFREEGARASVEWIRENVGFENIGLDEASIYQVSEDDLKEALTAYKKNV